jgi:hypothetical protein
MLVKPPRRLATPAGLFSSWQDETKEEQERLFYAHGFDEYQIIKPYHPPQEDSQKEATT